MFNTVVLIISPTLRCEMRYSPAWQSRHCRTREHSDCRTVTKSDGRPCATTSARILEMSTYLVELIIVLERRIAYIADFIPDWHIYRLGFNNRCSEMMLHRGHVGTMFRYHVLNVLTKYHQVAWRYVPLEDRFWHQDLDHIDHIRSSLVGLLPSFLWDVWRTCAIVQLGLQA